MNAPRRERLAGLVVAAPWLGGLFLAMRLGIAASDPAEVAGLLLAVYLGGWGLAFALWPRRRTVQAARFALCTFSVALAFGLFELPAWLGRIDYRDLFHTPTSPWRRHHHRPDRELIYVREGNVREHHRFIGGELAGLSGIGPAPVYTCDVSYDAEGFRNARALERADVVVVGDSFVEGLHVADDELMTSRLAEATGLRVANLGRSGDGPQQTLAVLGRFGLPKRPKVCVWMFYEGNDLADAAEYDGFRRAVVALGPISRSRELYERSFVRNALMYARRAWIAPARTRPAWLFRGRFADAELTFASEDHHRPVDEASLAKAVASIRRADDLCREQGSRLVVAFVPTKFRVYRDRCEFGPRSPCQDWRPSELPDRLRNRLAGIPMVDLTPALRDRDSDGELRYLADDTHWSASGHATAASVIAQAIRQSDGLAESTSRERR